MINSLTRSLQTIVLHIKNNHVTRDSAQISCNSNSNSKCKSSSSYKHHDQSKNFIPSIEISLFSTTLLVLSLLNKLASHNNEKLKAKRPPLSKLNRILEAEKSSQNMNLTNLHWAFRIEIRDFMFHSLIERPYS